MPAFTGMTIKNMNRQGAKTPRRAQWEDEAARKSLRAQRA
jgi:hypothetical protein